MALQSRGYTLPIHLLDILAEHPKTRSQIIAEAVIKAYKEPSILITSLKRRMNTPNQQHSKSSRVTVSITDQTINALASLTELTQLGTEHVLRLALEEYIHKRDW